MRDLIRKLLKEQEFTKVRNNPNLFGCYLFNGDERKFCLSAMKKIEENKTNIKHQFREILGLGLTYDKIKNKLIKYEKTNPFFLNSKKSFFDFMKKVSGTCDIAKVSIENEIRKFNDKIVVTFLENQNQTYHPINRLDTNVISLSYLLTIFRRKYPEIKSLNELYDKYFNITEKELDEGKFSVFFNQVFNYLGNDKTMDESLKDSFEEVLYTIKKTREMGSKSEEEGFKYLKKKFPLNEVIPYAGDFNFVDMMGVDGVMFSKKSEQWIPVQIKSNIGDCYGNRKFCKNICIGKNENGDWVEQYYDGGVKINPIPLSSNIPSNVDYFGSLGIK